MNETPEMVKLATDADTGLVWDQENRRLYDPETGEIVTLERVVDEGTAKAAAFRIWGTEASIAVLKRQRKALAKQISQREERLRMFHSLYLEDMRDVAKTMMEKAKTKAQSIRIGMGVVGYKKTRRSVEVKDTSTALAFVVANAPQSMKATIDFEYLTPERRRTLAAMVKNLSEIEEDAVSIDIRTSKIPDDLNAPLPEAGFDVKKGDDIEWYVKGDKPRGGDEDGETE